MALKTNMAGETPYKKFMFDTDFDELAERRARAKAAAEAARQKAEEAEPEPEPAIPTFSEEDLHRAREEGLAEGKRLGAEEAASTVEKQIAGALDTIAQQAQTLFQAQADANQEVTHHAVSVAAALVRKLFPTLNRQTALDQVQSMLEAVIGQVSSEPEIIVRVPASLAEDLHGRIEAVSEMSGFRGNVKILGDPALSVGDCRLEWSSGGVKRSALDLARQLDEIVARNLDNARPHDSTPAEDTQPTDDEPAPASEPEAERETAEATTTAPEASAPDDTGAATPEEAPAGAPMTDVPADAPAEPESGPAEDISEGPAPVPSADFIAEAGADAALHAPAADEGGPAPVPSEDLIAQAAPEEAEGVDKSVAEESEQEASEPHRYGGADLELEDDLKD
ncbi:MAG: hypothetical protein COW30_16335 [Rhodospirillales bacterium CG15_BIG_FIL_POST_REV_8_21_14_020_66_15]|nr:MAG: hypothetical protein COW30_16335 [Rhodospirillales bacterium CG15_BIG_FIL_POST_REV_8_21_14_020_66_15]